MYPNTQTKPHYRTSSAAAQLFSCTGTSCTCYTNVSAPFYSAPGGKKNKIKKTPSDKRLRTSRLFSFSLFFLFVFKCANSQWVRRKLQPAQLLERLQTKCARAREEHMCVHGAQTHTQTDIQMAYLCQIWLRSDCWQTQSGQWVCQLNQWSLWCGNCCSSRPEDTRRRRWSTANANSVSSTARSGIVVVTIRCRASIGNTDTMLILYN